MELKEGLRDSVVLLTLSYAADTWTMIECVSKVKNPHCGNERFGICCGRVGDT